MTIEAPHPNERLAELLAGPRRRRMFSHRDADNSTPRVSQDHQNEHEPACRSRHHEEIRGHDLSDVIRQEGAPRL